MKPTGPRARGRWRAILIFCFRIFVIQNDLFIHFWKILSNKVFLLIVIFSLFLFIFYIIFPLEIFMFFNQCNKEATCILIMRNKSHRILKTYFSGFLFSSWWEKSWLNFRIFSIFILFIVFKFSFKLSFLIFFLFLNDITNFPM